MKDLLAKLDFGMRIQQTGKKGRTATWIRTDKAEYWFFRIQNYTSIYTPV